MPEYFRILTHNLTQLLGAILGVTLNANETTSAWAYRTRMKRSWPYACINFIFFWQEDHCKAASEREIFSCLELLRAHNYEFPTEVKYVYSEAPKSKETRANTVEDFKPEVDKWSWNEQRYNEYMTPPEGHKAQLVFYTNIKEYGINPMNVAMPIDEYRHWNAKGIKEATTWIAENATPSPAKHNGMTS